MHSARAFADQYRQTSASSAILDASPHQLVSLMLGGARERVQLAIACLQRGDVARKAHAITSASGIIGGLNSTLDMKAGGEIAESLHALYDYFQRRLLEANSNNDPAPLAEVDELLGDIEQAWRAIDPEATGPAGGSQ